MNKLYPNTKLVFLVELEENQFGYLGQLSELTKYLEDNLGAVEDGEGPVALIQARYMTEEQIKALPDLDE